MSSQTVWPEERYSAFYKQQLRLCILDDFSAYSGGVHKYTDHVVREILKGMRRGIVKDFEMSWVESPDMDQPFNGRNIRNLLGGKDSQHAIWAVFDVYMKLTQPILAKGFSLEGNLERLGLVVADFIDPYERAPYKDTKFADLYSAKEADGIRLSLSIKDLPNRRFKLVHLIHERVDQTHFERKAANGEILIDAGARMDRGVLVPQTHGWLLMARDLETADISLGFAKLDGDNLSVRMISDENDQVISMKASDETKHNQLIRSASFADQEEELV